jgi:hypothetical protein
MMRAAALAALVASLLASSCIGEALASPAYVLDAARVAHAAADLGPGWEENFSVSCGTAPTAITTPGQVAYTCQNPSTTAVYVGGPNLTAASGVPSHCATNCISAEWSAHSRRGWCRVASGTITIACRALVGREAPVPVPPADAGP